MAKLKVTLKKSLSGSTKRQQATIKALGLGKVNSSVEVEATAPIKGMVSKVNHMLIVEEVK